MTESRNRPLGVMIVDDEVGVRALLTKVLEQAGFRVTSAPDGQQALELLESEPGDFDLVITDIVMPTLDGLELIRAITERYPSLPVIAISGGGYGNGLLYLRAAEALGAVGTLLKPFWNAELLEVVAKVAESSR